MDESEVKKGLDGVVVDVSAVSKVMQDINALTYRGCDVSQLCEICCFEAVAHLLLYGDLPTESQLKSFLAKERSSRKIDASLSKAIKLFPKDAHPMDAVRTAVSFLGMLDKQAGDNSQEANEQKAIRLLAKIPTVIAAFFRHRKGKEAIEPDEDLGISENFFHMCFGKPASKELTKAFEASLILYAEHGFNASTFTARVITSSLADFHGAVTGAIASLKGPLHGGANEAVMHMMEEIGDPAKAEQWLLQALKEKKKIMGFGHRVYKKGDSRVPTMKKHFFAVADFLGNTKYKQMYEKLAGTMIREKGIYPNLDFPAGPTYYLMGFDIDFFTPIFVMARITGWSAHIMEQFEKNKLIRPLSLYNGVETRKVLPLKERG